MGWFAYIGRLGDPLSRGAPAQILHAIAGRRLVARFFQKIEELFASNIEFSQRKGAQSDDMLRTLGIEPAGFRGRTSHCEASARNCDHDGTFGTFLELTFLISVVFAGCG